MFHSLPTSWSRSHPCSSINEEMHISILVHQPNHKQHSRQFRHRRGKKNHQTTHQLKDTNMKTKLPRTIQCLSLPGMHLHLRRISAALESRPITPTLNHSQGSPQSATFSVNSSNGSEQRNSERWFLLGLLKSKVQGKGKKPKTKPNQWENTASGQDQ